MSGNIDEGSFESETYYSSDTLDAIFFKSLSHKCNSIVSLILKTEHMDESVVVEIEKSLRKKKDKPCCVLFEASKVVTSPFPALKNVATMITTLEQEGTEFIKTGIIVKGIPKRLLDIIFSIKTPKKPTKSFEDMRDAYFYLSQID